MRCAKCGCERSSVVDSRSEGACIRRRRECQGCHYRFSTYERVERALPTVIKKDSTREPYNRDKLKSGVSRACEKRPVSVDAIDDLIDRVEARLSEIHAKEVASIKIGNLIMAELRQIDDIAYIRFASVYREFTDVKQFVDALNTLNP